MKIVSFYCDIDGKTFYSDCAERLKENCERLRIEHVIVERNYGDSWIDNVRAKPIFIKEMLDTLNEDIIMLDVDCEIIREMPKRKHGWGFMLRDDNTPHDFVHYINNTADSYQFVERWIKKIDNIGRGSHSAFLNIYHSLNSFVIPDGYFSLGLAETKSKTEYLQYDERYYNWHIANTGEYIFKTFSWFIDNYKPKSVIDYGCGVGYYLECAKHKGIEELMGFEKYGKKYASKKINKYITPYDISLPIKTEKYDCVLCIEAAEHIPQTRSEILVKNLCDSVGKNGVIVFSAAQPGQGGTGHINCQTREYWIEKFNKEGFCQDKEILTEILKAWGKMNCPDYMLNNLLIFAK